MISAEDARGMIEARDSEAVEDAISIADTAIAEAVRLGAYSVALDGDVWGAGSVMRSQPWVEAVAKLEDNGFMVRCTVQGGKPVTQVTW